MIHLPINLYNKPTQSLLEEYYENLYANKDKVKAKKRRVLIRPKRLNEILKDRREK